MARKKKTEKFRIKITVIVPVEMIEKKLNCGQSAENAKAGTVIMPKDGWNSVLEQVRKHIDSKLEIIDIAYY